MAIPAVDGKEIGGFWVSGTIPERGWNGVHARVCTVSRHGRAQCPRMGVHSVVQVSHAGGTVPAWLLPRVQWIQGVHCQRAQ